MNFLPLLIFRIMLAFQATRTSEAFSSSISPAVSVVIRMKSTLRRQLNVKEDDFISLGDEELDETTLAEVEAGKPSNWMIIQRVRNSFECFLLRIQSECKEMDLTFARVW